MGSVSLKVNEPSMEEILASIRRIIADDQEMRGPGSDDAAVTPLKSVLDLTERHFSPILHPPQAVSVDESIPAAGLENGSPDDCFVSSVVGTVQLDPPEIMPCAAGRILSGSAKLRADEPLLSDGSHAAVSGAFERLREAAAPAPSPSMAMTVEELMRDMLRPLLKDWLDKNLPALVERLVRAEIERLSRSRA